MFKTTIPYAKTFSKKVCLLLYLQGVAWFDFSSFPLFFFLRKMSRQCLLHPKVALGGGYSAHTSDLQIASRECQLQQLCPGRGTWPSCLLSVASDWECGLIGAETAPV